VLLHDRGLWQHLNPYRRERAEQRAFAYGGWPDIDELYQKQLTETDRAKREEILHEIQKILHARTRFAPIYDYFWPSGVGPRVEEASLLKIDPFPWAAPLEDVRLKRQ
jgi:peptide/nickel transport system substrate-binding protein